MVHARGNREAADETADLVRQLGRQAEVVLADVAESADCQRLVDEAWRWRPVDIWFNNAGADVLTGEPSAATFAEKLTLLWRVDVEGTLTLSRDVGGRMVQRGRGVILNMGWSQADTGMGGESGEFFATTKGAVMAYTRSLARSLAPAVRVNCVAPGWIKTAWGEQAPHYWDERARGECLLERWGTPGDVATVATFLVSPDAAFINGQVIHIDGGLRGASENAR